MINEEDFIKNSIQNRNWLGKVINNEDPEGEGRIKIRVFGLYNELEDEEIPWAYPGNQITSSSETGGSFYSIPKLESIIEVKFDSDDIYHPIYTRHLHLSEEVKREIDGDQNAHILWYDVDQDLQVFYTTEKGLIFKLKNTLFNITNDNEIIIKNNDKVNVLKLANDGRVTLTADNVDVVVNERCEITTPDLNLTGAETKLGAAPDFSAILAEPLWAFLKVLASATDSKWPATPGVLSSAAEQAERASTSRTVKTSI